LREIGLTEMYYQLELVYVGLILIALVTYRIKNRFLLWPLILIPPLFLVPLYWIRIDLLTMIFWMPAIVAVTWSAISLLINGVRAVVGLITGRPQVSLFKIRLIRPSLTIIIFLFVSLSVHLSKASADKYGIEISKKIQKRAKVDGVCPDKIEGWSTGGHDDTTCHSLYGEYGTKYPLEYIRSEGKKQFTIYVKHAFDEVLKITGGVDQGLKATLYADPTDKEIPIAEDK